MKKLLPITFLAVALLAGCADSSTTTTTGADSTQVAAKDSTPTTPVDSQATVEVTPVDSPLAPPPVDPGTSGQQGSSDNARKGNPDPIVTNHRITVSFISIGGGPDYKTKEKLDKYIVDFGKKNGVKLQYEQVGWGREGEIDYCFPLSEVKEPAKSTFVKEVKAFVGENELVKIKENTTCRKPRK